MTMLKAACPTDATCAHKHNILNPLAPQQQATRISSLHFMSNDAVNELPVNASPQIHAVLLQQSDLPVKIVIQISQMLAVVARVTNGV